MNFLLDLDLSLFHFINNQLSVIWLDPLMIGITAMGKWPWVAGLAWVAFMIKGGKRERQAGISLIILLLISDFVCGSLLKPMLGRVRPYIDLDNTILLVSSTKQLSQFSFPSSHAMNCFSVATFISLVYRKTWIFLPSIFIASLVAFSRVYIGVHYPLDVAAGGLMGILFGVSGYTIFNLFLQPEMKRRAIILSVFILAGLASIVLFKTDRAHTIWEKPRNVIQKAIPMTPPIRKPTIEPTASPIRSKKDSSETDLEKLQRQMMNQLNETSSSNRLLDVPSPPLKKPDDKFSRSIEKIKAHDAPRVEGIEKRRPLPVGVILFDNTKCFRSAKGNNVIFTMQTGDFVKVYPDKKSSNRWHIHPGADVFLAATSKETEIAGMRFPDVDGWVKRHKIHIFDPKQEKEFTQGSEPITMGTDPNFSTVSFYERAFKNSDPVVHRVIGPRLIDLLSFHEGYISTWRNLYRDPDSKIRSVSLATIRKRGVNDSRAIIEDLILRLAEQTRIRAHGAIEAEIISILNILKESNHPRVPSALMSYVETWEKTQNPNVIQSLKDTIDHYKKTTQ